jgi:hypothetical protein
MEENKYNFSKIYKIISNKTDKIYIGSTIQPLSKRKFAHKKTYEKFKNNDYHYVSSFDLFELGDIDIILIENFKCKSKEELHSRERYYIELNKELCVNKNIPSRSKKERYENDKEKIKENYKKNKKYICEVKKKYYEKNKETIINKKAIKTDCECGGKFKNSNKSRHFKSKKHLNFITIN